MSNPAAAPAPISINGIDYLMSPLTSKDITELNMFIKQEILATAKEFCKDESNKNIIDATMKAAMEQTRTVDWIVDSSLLQSVDRLIYLFWMGIRNNPPRPSRSVFAAAALNDWDTYFDIFMDTLQLVNPFLQLKKGEKKGVEEEAEIQSA